MTVTTTQIPIGLVATQVLIDTVTDTPAVVLGNPIPQGRHMITFYDGGNSSYIGAIDLMITSGIQTLAISDTCYSTSSPSVDWNFNLDTCSLTMTWDTENNNFVVTSTEPFNNLVIREFVIPVYENVNNIYAVDRIQANLAAANSPVTFASPIVQSATGPNAVNLGQSLVTQATSISTAVTANNSSGVITTVSATTAAGSTDSFTVNNTTTTATSAVLVTLCDYTGTTTPPVLTVSSVSNGSFIVNITNYASSALDGVLKISFLCC